MEYIIDNPLTDDPRYSSYLHLAWQHYRKLCETYGLEVRPYQPEMGALYALRANNICAGSCGLGKTFIVGLTICILFTEFKRKGQIQITVPSHLSGKGRWMVDLVRLEALKGHVEFISTEKQLLDSQASIWVYTHDFLKRKSTLKGYPTLGDYIVKRYPPNLFVCDEIHRLKPKTQRTEAWLKVKLKAKRCLGLSGTLTDSRISLLGSILNLVYGKNFPLTPEAFELKFKSTTLVKTNYLRGSVPLAETKLRHLPQINILLLPEYARLIKRYVHTVSLSDPNVRDVIKIPERVDEYIACEPHSDHVAEYLAKIRSIKDKVLAMREHKSMMALSLLNPLLELSSFPSTPTIPNIKLDRTLELCEAVKGKTAIFVTRVKTGRELFNTLKTTYGDKGVIRLYAKDDQVKPAILSHEKREDIVNEFLFNPKIKVGVFSILLASESIDLNQVEQVIFYGYPWSSLDVIQALFRAVRPGNPYPQVQVKFLYNRGMIDEHQLTLLSEGSKASKALLNFDPNSTLIDGDYLIKNTLNL